VTAELELERRAQRLVGRRVCRVWYDDARTLGAAVHEVAAAVHLELDDGRRPRIAWSRELATRHGFGVALGEQQTLPPTVREVTGAPWAIDSPVTAARIHWRAIEDALRAGLRVNLAIGADHLTRYDFPQSLELVCGDRSVFVAAARLIAPDSAEGFASSLLVVDGAGALARLGLR